MSDPSIINTSEESGSDYSHHSGAGAALVRFLPLALLVLTFILSRVFYWSALGVRFDIEPLGYYLQYVDPVLRKTSLTESVYHLHGQPPLFNFFLGLVLKFFPGNEAAAYHGIYLVCGLVIVVSLFELMTELGVRHAIAAAVIFLFMVSPVTLLYENWLFYTYPVTAILTLSVLLLYRFARYGRSPDAFLLFCTLAVICLTRGIFHIFWIFLIVGTSWMMWKERRRAILVTALIPVASVLLVYIKNFMLFGVLSTGQLYQQTNLSMMTVNRIPQSQRHALIKQNLLSVVSLIPVYGTQLSDYEKFLPERPESGIAVLDQEVKSTGVSNWHNRRYLDVGELYGRNGMSVLKNYPFTYIDSVIQNFINYFKPAGYTFPFYRTDYENTNRMHSSLGVFNLITTGQLTRAGPGWLLVIGFPILAGFGGIRITRWIGKRRKMPDSNERRMFDAAGITLAYCLFNILYVAAITIIFSSDDHNRYRFIVSPMYCLLLALFLTELLDKSKTRSRAS